MTLKISFFAKVSAMPFMLFLQGCAVGPLVVHEPARTVGKGQHELIAGYGHPGAVLKWNVGVAEDLDLGVQFESLSLGLRAKYAWINEKERGLSLATAAGFGASIGGSHYYGDLILSHRSPQIEPYAAVRAVRVKTDPTEFRDENTGELEFRVEEAEYSYGQGTLGIRAWPTKTWLISAEASTLFTLSDSLTIVGTNVFIGAATGFTF